MDDLLEQFLVEGRDLVAEGHGALLVLGREPRNRAALDSLFRATHTLKGSVALFDMAPAMHLLHAAESRLDLARKGEALLDGPILDALVAVIDQTDRWIDAVERSGTLEKDAPATSNRLAAMLVAEGEGPGRDGAGDERERAGEAWRDTVLARPHFAAVERDDVRTAFRYAPDPDCFFRGEDPLALVAAVPGLLGLAVLPAGDAWPALAACEPFRCMSALEGLSSADGAAVRATFRLVPDQVLVAAVTGQDPAAALARTVEQARETTITLRVDAAKLDGLADRSGELGVAIRALAPIGERLRLADPVLAAALRTVHDEIERIAGALQRTVAQVRLVPLEPVLRRLPRLAREAAASLGKSVRFTLVGEMLQVDKQIADQLFEPLLHLLRNAIGHGLETPADRAAAGKPAEGDIRLSVAQQGEMIEITLGDDGCGIDPVKMRDVAIARALLSAEDAAALGDDEARRLIFLPGFSTAATTTSLSGRGVGMDAVRASIDRLGGAISLESVVGAGTSMTLRLPANAMTTPLLVVEAGGQKLGLRLDHVVETARVDAGAIHAVGHGQACVLRDATVPVLDLARRLGLGEAQGDRARLVIVDAGTGRTAIRVSRFGDRIDAVVKPRAGLLARLPALSGTAMMPDGSVLLVLDLPELVT